MQKKSRTPGDQISRMCMISNFCELNWLLKSGLSIFASLHIWAYWSPGPADFFLPGFYNEVHQFWTDFWSDSQFSRSRWIFAPRRPWNSTSLRLGFFSLTWTPETLRTLWRAVEKCFGRSFEPQGTVACGVSRLWVGFLNIRKSYSANSVSTFEQISRKQRYKPDLQDLSPGAYSEYLKASQGHS